MRRKTEIWKFLKNKKDLIKDKYRFSINLAYKNHSFKISFKFEKTGILMDKIMDVKKGTMLVLNILYRFDWIPTK